MFIHAKLLMLKTDLCNVMLLMLTIGYANCGVFTHVKVLMLKTGIY